MATTYNFPSHIDGDTVQAITFTITVNAVALDLTGASARMDLRNANEQLLQRFGTSGVEGATGTLSIVAPATDGKLRFDEQIVDVEPGTHDYDIEITLSDGSVHTYIEGQWTITQDQSHD